MGLDIGAGLQSGAGVLQGFMGAHIQAGITDDLAKKAADRALTNEERMMSTKSMLEEQADARREVMRRGGAKFDTQHQIDSTPGMAAAKVGAEITSTNAMAGDQSFIRNTGILSRAKETLADRAAAANSSASAAKTNLETKGMQNILDLQKELDNAKTPEEAKLIVAKLARRSGEKTPSKRYESRVAQDENMVNRIHVTDMFTGEVYIGGTVAAKSKIPVYNPSTGKFD